jgi:hypothetical protein
LGTYVLLIRITALLSFSRADPIIYQIARARPAFEQVFERFTDDGFAAGAGNLAQVLKLVQVLLNENLAHVAVVMWIAALYRKTENLARQRGEGLRFSFNPYFLDVSDFRQIFKSFVLSNIER